MTKKGEHAIAFAYWIADNGWEPQGNEFKGYWHQPWKSGTSDEEPIQSSEQLYNRFIKESQQNR